VANEALHEYWRILGRRLDGHVSRALGPLTDEQFHWVPSPTSNTIAFIAWHLLRTEDNAINWIIQERRPTVWMEGNWAEKLGLPAVSQGTGMPREDAQTLRILDVQGFNEYAMAVRARTTEFLDQWDDEEDYQKLVTLKPVGQMTKMVLLGQQGLPHSLGHIGEIQEIRALLDLPGIGL